VFVSSAVIENKLIFVFILFQLTRNITGQKPTKPQSRRSSAQKAKLNAGPENAGPTTCAENAAIMSVISERNVLINNYDC